MPTCTIVTTVLWRSTDLWTFALFYSWSPSDEKWDWPWTNLPNDRACTCLLDWYCFLSYVLQYWISFSDQLKQTSSSEPSLLVEGNLKFQNRWSTNDKVEYMHVPRAQRMGRLQCSAATPFFLGRVIWGQQKCAVINGTNNPVLRQRAWFVDCSWGRWWSATLI